MDATNELSYMMMETVAHLRLSAPSFSIRVWAGTPVKFLYRACELARLGYGLPAMYNEKLLSQLLQTVEFLFMMPVVTVLSAV